MAITADNRYLFVGSLYLGDVKQFRVSDGSMIKHYRGVCDGGVRSMITTPDSKYLFAGGEHGTIEQICPESQEVVHNYGKIHDYSISCLQTSRDSKYLITGSFDGCVKRMSIENRLVEKKFEFHFD